MVKYYKPEDIEINTGVNTHTITEWIGREVVSFGLNGYYPWRKNIDWVWDITTGTMTILINEATFIGSYHFEFATDTNAIQDYSDVTAVGGNLRQYPHILKYDINSWATEDDEPVHIERRCRCRFTTKGIVEFNGNVARAVIYLPLPELTIQEGIPVEVWDGDKIYETGMVIQHRTNALYFNQRLWL